MKSKNLALIAALLAVMVAALPEIAAAGDSKTYHGSICESDGLTYAPYIEKNLSGAFNKITTSQSIKVVCPIIRDNTRALNGFPGVYVRIKNVSGSVSCELISRDYRGYQLNPNESRAKGSVSGNGIYEILLATIYSGDKGYFELVCSLPRDAGILGYQATEY